MWWYTNHQGCIKNEKIFQLSYAMWDNVRDHNPSHCGYKKMSETIALHTVATR